ncbi:MAG: hypothetical protein CK521_05055 [Acidimicrobium sp.]|nr:MAG: hypothetical protein CK521_05055 [Acidimicrobium sp.]
MESTNTDMEVVAQLRTARVAAVLESSKGNVSSVLEAPHDSHEAQVYVVKLLDVSPRLGKVAGRRLMADLSIAPLSRVHELTEAQRRALIDVVENPR